MIPAIQPLEGPAGQIYAWLLQHRHVTPWHAVVESLVAVNALAGSRFMWGACTVSVALGLADGPHTKGSAAACRSANERLLAAFNISSCHGMANAPEHHSGLLVTAERKEHRWAPSGQVFISREPPFRDARPAGDHPIPDSLLEACRTIRNAPGCVVRADDFNRHLLQQLDDMDFDAGAAMVSCLLAINRNPLHPVVTNRDTRTALTLYGIRSGNYEALADLCERLRDMDALAAVRHG